MVEKRFVTGAEIVQARFSVWCGQESAFRTFAVASKPNVALTAIFGQRVELVPPELKLLLRGGQLNNREIVDVAHQIIWLYKMIAGIKIAIVFQCQSQTASWFKNAHAGRGKAHPVA